MEKLTIRQTYSKGRKSSACKYHIKTSNCEKRRAKMQDIGIAFEIKKPATLNNLVYI